MNPSGKRRYEPRGDKDSQVTSEMSIVSVPLEVEDKGEKFRPARMA